jgi:ribonuclease HI
VEALRLFKEQGIPLPVYSDSQVAIGWVEKGKCGTTLARTKNNTQLFRLIEEAETWLLENEYENELLKWKTDQWGQIPADYGRK